MPATAERVDTWEMVLVHRVFRREFRLLPGLIRAVTPGDRARAAVLAEHLTTITTALHHHHAGEDELLWPPLVGRVGMRAELVHRMEAQHERLHVLLERIDALTPRWREQAAATDRDELAGLIAQASVALDEHLADEENELLPLVEQHITPAEWHALNKRGQDSIPKNAKAFLFLGMIFEEASAAETTRFLRELPPPVRWAWRLAGERVYARSLVRLRGA